jgi:hypothetical protein
VVDGTFHTIPTVGLGWEFFVSAGTLIAVNLLKALFKLLNSQFFASDNVRKLEMCTSSSSSIVPFSI